MNRRTFLAGAASLAAVPPPLDEGITELRLSDDHAITVVGGDGSEWRIECEQAPPDRRVIQRGNLLDNSDLYRVLRDPEYAAWLNRQKPWTI